MEAAVEAFVTGRFSLSRFEREVETILLSECPAGHPVPIDWPRWWEREDQ